MKIEAFGGGLPGIEDSQEIEALRGSGRAGLTAVQPREKFGHPVGGASPSPDLDQAPHNIPDHVVDEAVRGKKDTDQPASGTDSGGKNLTDRVAVSTCRGAERRKIMFPPEMNKGLPHGADVQITRHPPGPPTPEDGFNGAIQDHIGVSPGQGPATRIKIR